MKALGVPGSLINNDTNLDNLLIDESGCVVTDWADGYVGHPFLAFHHLWAHVAKADKEESRWASHLKQLYKMQWHEGIAEEKIERGLALAPVLAITLYLYG